MWNEILIYIVETILGIVIPIGITYGLYLLKKKINNDEFKTIIEEVEKVIIDCVGMVNQTFVNTLKQNEQFDDAAKKEAFNKCYAAICDTLSDSAKSIIQSFVGDIEEYLTNKIEAEVGLQKKI